MPDPAGLTEQLSLVHFLSSFNLSEVLCKRGSSPPTDLNSARVESGLGVSLAEASAGSPTDALSPHPRPSWLRHQHIPEGSRALQHEFQWVFNACYVTAAWYKGGLVPSVSSVILTLLVSAQGIAGVLLPAVDGRTERTPL